MSTTLIIAIIAIGLFVLVFVGITLQTIDKNTKEKRRMESNLLSRSRNFSYMLEGFPEGFLNRDLQILVCNCLEEVYSQLVQIAPKNRDYRAKLERAQLRTAECRKQEAVNQTVTLTDNEQIREVQKMLNSLYNFIAKLAASGRINNKEAKIYGKQVRRLVVQTSTDALIEPIKEALKNGKPRLAIHYLHMANTKMKKENDDGFYNDRISKQTARIQELEDAASAQDKKSKALKNKTAEEWDDLEKPDDSWKKKAIYD